MRTGLCMLALLWPMAASGQTVFFDDFEGNALLPHWSQPPPPPGIYHFAIARVGTTFEFYFNGNLFGSLTGTDIPATGVVLNFMGPYPGEFGTFHIDRVQVIPAPGSLLFLLALALGCGRPTRG